MLLFSFFFSLFFCPFYLEMLFFRIASDFIFYECCFCIVYRFLHTNKYAFVIYALHELFKQTMDGKSIFLNILVQLALSFQSFIFSVSCYHHDSFSFLILFLVYPLPSHPPPFLFYHVVVIGSFFP